MRTEYRRRWRRLLILSGAAVSSNSSLSRSSSATRWHNSLLSSSHFTLLSNQFCFSNSRSASDVEVASWSELRRVRGDHDFNEQTSIWRAYPRQHAWLNSKHQPLCMTSQATFQLSPLSFSEPQFHRLDSHRCLQAQSDCPSGWCTQSQTTSASVQEVNEVKEGEREREGRNLLLHDLFSSDFVVLSQNIQLGFGPISLVRYLGNLLLQLIDSLCKGQEVFDDRSVVLTLGRNIRIAARSFAFRHLSPCRCLSINRPDRGNIWREERRHPREILAFFRLCEFVNQELKNPSQITIFCGKNGRG
jgi:hypothetical protein